jgi:hypothetical protein
MYGWEESVAVIAFRMKGRMLRFVLPLPDKNAPDLRLTPTGRKRTPNAARESYEQAVRQRWRALALVIKAKLEAVESGITSFEREFLGNILLPDGQTAGDWMEPQIEQAYAVGDMPRLLPLLPIR